MNKMYLRSQGRWEPGFLNQIQEDLSLFDWLKHNTEPDLKILLVSALRAKYQNHEWQLVKMTKQHFLADLILELAAEIHATHRCWAHKQEANKRAGVFRNITKAQK